MCTFIFPQLNFPQMVSVISPFLPTNVWFTPYDTMLFPFYIFFTEIWLCSSRLDILFQQIQSLI